MSAENNTNIYMLQQQYIVMSTPLQVYNHEETRIREVKYFICQTFEGKGQQCFSVENKHFLDKVSSH